MKNHGLDLKDFQIINDKLSVCYKDESILYLAEKFEIKDALLNAKIENIDFITASIFSENIEDIHLFIFYYAGSTEDSGFICFELPNFVKNNTNILPLLNQLYEYSPLLNFEGFKNYLISIVYNHYKKLLNEQKKIIHLDNPSNLIFSFIQ